MDVAIDFINAAPADLYVRPVGKFTKVQCYHGPEHELQTVMYYTGKKTTDPAVKAYDRRALKKDGGKAPTYGSLPHTRVEVVRRLHGTKLNALHAIKNPLGRIRVGWLPDILHNADSEMGWLLDSLRLRGMKQHAGTNGAELLAASETPLWDANAIWEEWPQAISSCGLGGWISKIPTGD